MVQSTRSKAANIKPPKFMPATTSMTMAAFSAMWQDLRRMQRKYWHRWLDLCEELSYALAFYQEWHRRHRL